MSKYEYINGLFDDIKDNIVLDFDVICLKNLLVKILDFDVQDSIKKWKYVINNYNIKELASDIDFTPLMKDYPEVLITHIGLPEFFKVTKDILKDTLKYMYMYLFNVYEYNSFIYTYLKQFIKNKKHSDVLDLVNIFLNQQADFFEGVFDKTEFIKRIVLILVEKEEDFSLDLAQQLLELIDDKKDKATIKTLFIDFV